MRSLGPLPCSPPPLGAGLFDREGGAQPRMIQAWSMVGGAISRS